MKRKTNKLLSVMLAIIIVLSAVSGIMIHAFAEDTNGSRIDNVINFSATPQQTGENVIIVDQDVNTICCIDYLNIPYYIGKSLPGASFKLYKSDGKTLITEWTTNNFTTTIKGLTPGEYIIKNTKACFGMLPASDTKIIVANTSDVQTFVVCCKRDYSGSITFNLKTELGKPVSNASVVLIKRSQVDSSNVKELKTDANGSVYFNDLEIKTIDISPLVCYELYVSLPFGYHFDMYEDGPSTKNISNLYFTNDKNMVINQTVYNDADLGSNVSLKSFPDVPKNTWYYDAVVSMKEYGWMTGYSNGYFGPTDNVQRQDFAVMMARIVNADLSVYEGVKSTYPDVPDKSYYTAAVLWAKDNGVITGYTNGKFGVGDPITREQICTILLRMGQKCNSSMTLKTTYEEVAEKFPDGNLTSPWARTAVAWCFENGIIGQSKKLNPIGFATRAEIAVMMYRVFINNDDAIIQYWNFK